MKHKHRKMKKTLATLATRKGGKTKRKPRTITPYDWAGHLLFLGWGYRPKTD